MARRSFSAYATVPASYDEEGRRADGRRQILGYSRAIQGGADQARARAARRMAIARDPGILEREAREENVQASQAAGTFDYLRDRYNRRAGNMEMDEQGNIRPRTVEAAPPSDEVTIPAAGGGYKTVKRPGPTPARLPAYLKRPKGQEEAERVAAEAVPPAAYDVSPAGLTGLLAQARRRRPLVMR